MSQQEQNKNKISKTQKKIYNQNYYQKKIKNKHFYDFCIIHNFIINYYEIDFDDDFLNECFNLWLNQNHILYIK